jgi:hypothetical protein
VLGDSDVNVIVRDRGSLRHSFLFDTLGEGQPGGEFVEDAGTTEVHGAHPGFAEDFRFCDIVDGLTGA